MDYRVIRQTFLGARLTAEEHYSHPTSKNEAQKIAKEARESVIQPLTGETYVIIVRPC